MEARQLVIERKHRQPHDCLTSLKDFSYREGTLVNPNAIIENPQISLYCLDDSARQAVFVEVPADVELTTAPFACRTQYEQAQQLITLSYEAFNQLADHLPEVRQPVFVHTPGRSGSTLLHHAFNESQVAVSLSEPDVPTQFANLLHDANRDREAELHTLAHSALRFLFKSHHDRGRFAHALKLRRQSIRAMDLFQAVFPRARHIFLYRSAIGYVTSSHRILQNYDPVYPSFHTWRGEHERLWGADLSHLAQYLDDSEAMPLVKQLTLRWIAAMEWYLAQVERGTPALAIRYADLVEGREQTLGEIFGYCGLPLDSVQRGLRAYQRDSQAGTPLARENPKQGNQRTLSQTQIDVITAILRRHPVLNFSDFDVPSVPDNPHR